MMPKIASSCSILLSLALASSVGTGCAEDQAGPIDEASPGSDGARGGGASKPDPQAELGTPLPADQAAITYELAPDHEEWMNAAAEGIDESAAAGTAAKPAIAGAMPSCNAADLSLSVWPLTGSSGRNWMINNYVDLDASASTLDWKGKTGGLARTYNGHQGMDVDVASFREMDGETMLVRAASPGVVDRLDDTQFDRNTSCAGNWNFVRVKQANGFYIYYGHLKRGSVVVHVGDSVVAGQKLGIVGSSGCSSAPHLHLEVQNCSQVAVEPNNLGMWVSPPAYDAPSDVMDVMLRKDQFVSADQIKDPIANPTLYKPGETLGIGLSLAGRGGDNVTLSLTAPDATVDSWSWTLPGVARYGHWYPSWWKPVGSTVGTWTLRVYVNNSLRQVRYYGVSTVDPGWGEVARHGVYGPSYQQVFTDITTAGYRPVWVDGFDINGTTFFNAIFRPSNGYGWVARHGLDATQYQNEYNTWTGAGYRIAQVDSYLSSGSVRYAVIFTAEPRPVQYAYHGVDENTHVANFNWLAGLGYHAVNVSVVDVGGARRFTALWEQANVGGWVGRHRMTGAEYQAEYNAQANAGRHLKYLNAYTLGGQVFYSGVWDSLAWGGGWEPAVHGRSGADYQANFNNFTGQGLQTKFVTGVGAGGTALYAALWSN